MFLKYIMECNHCGKEFTAQNVWDTTQDEITDETKIDINSVGGFGVHCPHCGCEYYVPDLSDYIECDESTCFDAEEEVDDQDYDEDQDMEEENEEDDD